MLNIFHLIQSQQQLAELGSPLSVEVPSGCCPYVVVCLHQGLWFYYTQFLFCSCQCMCPTCQSKVLDEVHLLKVNNKKSLRLCSNVYLVQQTLKMETCKNKRKTLSQSSWNRQKCILLKSTFCLCLILSGDMHLTAKTQINLYANTHSHRAVSSSLSLVLF